MPLRPGESYREKTRTALGADGTRLAWRVEGEVGPALVICNGLANDEYFWRPLIRRLRRRYRVLSWDYRGHGESDAPKDADAITIPAMVDDLECVLAAAGIEHASLLAFSLGCQVALEAVRRHPAQVDALVLAFGSYQRPFDNFYPPLGGRVLPHLLRAAPTAVVDKGLQIIVHSGRFGYLASRLGHVVEPAVRYAWWGGYYEQLSRHDADSFRAFALAGQAHSAASVLPTITAPTLVIAGGLDSFAPPRIAHEMADRIPGARLLDLPHASHTGLLGHAGPIGDALDSFLPQPRRVPR